MFVLFLRTIPMQSMAAESIAEGFQGTHVLCSSWLAFWVESTALQWEMQVAVPWKIRILSCMCLSISDFGYWSYKLYLYIHIQAPWHIYACAVKSICFNRNCGSVFQKSTEFCCFIIVCVAFLLLYVEVTGSHLLSSVPSHLLYHERGISATEETLLICVFFFHRVLVLLTLLFSKLAFPFFHMFNTSCVLLQFLI